jgi:hypothetical protein
MPRDYPTVKAAGWASPAHITFAGDRKDWEWRRISAHPESAFSQKSSTLVTVAERPRM